MDKPSKRKLIKWLVVCLALLLLAIAVAACTVAVAAKQFRDSDRIAAGVSIEGVDVSNMTAGQARLAVMQDWIPQLPQQVELHWVNGSVSPSPEQLGARLRIKQAVAQAQRVGREGSAFTQILTRIKLSRTGVDLPVEVQVDRKELEGYLVELASTVNRKPRNADFEVVGDSVKVIPGEVGVELDIPQSVATVAKGVVDPQNASFQLVTDTQQPTIRAEDLQHLENVLASYSTEFKPWQKDRTHNLRLAIGNLSRAVVKPGETLSFNERVGPRLSEKGWRDAPIFINGEIEPSTGGGICQVASTVYNAALLANLDITERHHHSRPVAYTPSGRDATVYWGQFDLKLRNSLTHPILILGEIGERTITVRILGSHADKADVEIVRSGVGSLDYGKKEVPDPELEEGKREIEKPGRRGAVVTVTRVVKKGGVVVASERLHTDRYSAQTEVTRVGTKPPDAVELGPDGKPLPVPGAAPSPGATKPSEAKPKPVEKPAAARPAPSSRPTPESED